MHNMEVREILPPFCCQKIVQLLSLKLILFAVRVIIILEFLCDFVANYNN